MQQIDLENLSPYQRYKLMAALIVPRPIALVTSLNDNGVVNAAPFSLFNFVGEDPPLVMFSVNKVEDGLQKDTVRNLKRLGEFVVHICDEKIVQAVHDCGHAFAPDISEVDATGLTTRSSARVSVPSIAQAPVAFECVLHDTLESDSRYVFFGRVIWLSTKDGLIDPETQRVKLSDHQPPGRMGAGLYVKTSETFPVFSSFDNGPTKRPAR